MNPQLIALIKAHPEYAYDEYACALNISRATVARHIKKLNGTIIKRIGSDKTDIGNLSQTNNENYKNPFPSRLLRFGQLHTCPSIEASICW